MVCIGFGVFLFSGFQVMLFSLFAENTVFKTKIQYFSKTLRKDAAFFDEQNPTEMASKISKECSAIQRGTGEKVGNVAMAAASFIAGFAFSFYWGWLFTVILLGAFPFLALMGMGMGIAMQDGFGEQMRAYSQSAGYAEQAL